MGDKYVVRKESDIWGNDQTVIRRGVSASDVGGAIGLGAGLIYAAHKNSQVKAATNSVEITQKYLENGDFDKALTSANTLIAMSDKEAQTVGHFFKASALTALERYDEAIAEFGTTLDMARALNQLDSVVIAYVGRGKCYYQKNDLGAAMRDFTSYIQAQPNEDMGYFWQALALVKLGDLDQALSNFNKAISINPGDGSNYRERAEVYVRRNDVTQAIADFSRAITLNPQDGYAYRRRAELYAGMNDDAHAITDYSRAIELTPDDLESYKGRAAAYQRTGNAAGSANDMGKVGREEPIQQTYQQYLQAANTAYNSGVTAVYTEMDTAPRPGWGGAIAQVIILGIICLVAMGYCASATRNPYSGSDSSGSILILGLLVMGGLIWAVIASTRSAAANKAKAATSYIAMRNQNSLRMPGFEEFFSHFLQAKKDAQLQDLPKRTRPFFESGAGRSAVQAYSSGNRP